MHTLCVVYFGGSLQSPSVQWPPGGRAQRGAALPWAQLSGSVLIWLAAVPCSLGQVTAPTALPSLSLLVCKKGLVHRVADGHVPCAPGPADFFRSPMGVTGVAPSFLVTVTRCWLCRSLLGVGRRGSHVACLCRRLGSCLAGGRKLSSASLVRRWCGGQLEWR